MFHGNDLFLAHSTPEDLDEMAGVPGFGEAMVSVGWAAVSEDGNGVTLPSFKTYNVPLTAAERQQRRRERMKTKPPENRHGESRIVTNCHAPEKIREEKKKINNPPTPQGGKQQKPDPIWDVAVELWHPSGVPPSQIKAIGRSVADLKALEATLDQIRERREEHLRKWPDITCTLRSVVKHWDTLTKPKRKPNRFLDD